MNLLYSIWNIFFCSFWKENGHFHVFSTLTNAWNIERWFDIVRRCKFQGWNTQRCFKVDLTLSNVATSYHPKDNVETLSKCLLGLVLVKAEMQIQLCKYSNCSPFFSYIFIKFSFFWFLRVHFFVFSFLTNWKISLSHLLVYSEAGIKSCSVKQLFGKISPTSLFFYKIGVSFQCSLLNKKIYKYIKSEILRRYSSRVMVK